VDFREVSLGGEAGQALVSGILAKLAWLSLLVIGMALVAPRATAWLARSLPVWIQTAWERRWPHRIVEAIGSFIAYIFRRPSREPEPEPVIGSETLHTRFEASPVSFETPPVTFRPSIDPASPASPLG